MKIKTKIIDTADKITRFIFKGNKIYILTGALMFTFLGISLATTTEQEEQLKQRQNLNHIHWP